METAISLSQIGLYNPQRQSAALTEALFVARQKEFNSLMESLNEEMPDSVPQHHLITAQRGMGKTTLLKRIEVELHKEQYRKKFIPLLPSEEQYDLSDLPNLWYNCLDVLGTSLEVESANNKEDIKKIEKDTEIIWQENKNSSDLGEKLYNYLMSVCKQIGRRPVLLIDNIGLAFHRLSKQEQNLLRAYLSEPGCPIVIGAGVAMAGISETKEHVVNYKMPFYEFFQSHKLKKLNLVELIEILYNLSKITQISITINSENKTHIQSLFQLTGGNPRTVVMLFKLLVKGFSESIVEDLEALLDESTPYNKSRFEELPTRQQIILNAIAQNWDPIHISELSEVTRYKNSELSPHLTRLIEASWIETTKVDTREWDVKPKVSKENKVKGNVYSISERFLSIWLIMRNGRRQRKNDIRKVLESYEWIYGKDNSKREDRQQIEKEMMLKKTQEQIEKEIEESCNKKDYNGAFAIAECMENESNKQSAMGYIYMEAGNCREAEDKYRKALVLDDKNADNWSNLGYCLISQEKYEEAEELLKQSIELSKGGDIDKWNALTYSFFNQGKLTEAESAARKTISLDKNNINNWNNLFQILMEQEKYVETEKEMQVMTQENKYDTNAWNILGDFYYATEKNEEAEKAYKKAVKSDKNNIQALFNLSASYLKLKHKDKAETVIEEVKTIGGDKSNVWNSIGDFYVSIEKHETAEEAYKKAIDLDEKNIQARFDIINLYVRLNRIDEAETQVEIISELAKDNPNILAMMGDFYVNVKKNKYEKAEELYKEAISLNENNPKIWFSLNKLYAQLNRYDEAEEAMQKILVLDKNNTNAWDAAGDFYSAIEKYIKSEEAYKNAIELDTENLQARFDLSKLYIKLNRNDDAEKEIQNIEKLDTDNNNAGTIGQLYFEVNKYAEAEKYLLQAVNLDDTDDMSWWRLGMSLLYQEKYAEAEDALKQAIELDKTDSYNWNYLGTSLFAQDKYAEAEDVFRQAAEIDNDNADFWFYLGVSLSMQEKYKEAIEVFNKAIELDPNNANAYRFLGDTYEDIREHKKAIECYNKSIELDQTDPSKYSQRGFSYSEMKESLKALADFSKAIEINPNYAIAYVNRGWEYTYREECKDYDKAITNYTKAIELDANCNAKKLLTRLYRDIKNQFDKAEELFNTLDATKTPKDVYCLEQTLFELHKRNEGIASDYLSKALEEIENKLNPKTQGNWEYFAAITIKIGYAQWLLDILSEKGFDVILSPFFVAIQALEVEKANNQEVAETYLKNQAIEKSEPARIIIEKMKMYL